MEFTRNKDKKHALVLLSQTGWWLLFHSNSEDNCIWVLFLEFHIELSMLVQMTIHHHNNYHPLEGHYAYKMALAIVIAVVMSLFKKS